MKSAAFATAQVAAAFAAYPNAARKQLLLLRVNYRNCGQH